MTVLFHCCFVTRQQRTPNRFRKKCGQSKITLCLAILVEVTRDANSECQTYSGASSQTIPRSLRRFKTHPQGRLGTFETKMAVRNAKRSIWTILWKRRGLCTASLTTGARLRLANLQSREYKCSVEYRYRIAVHTQSGQLFFSARKSIWYTVNIA